MKSYRKVTSCRICGNVHLYKYLKLKPIHIINKFTAKPSLKKTYPLEVLFCPVCSLSQLSVVVYPQLMFADYSYRSSVSEPMILHFAELAKKLKTIYVGNKTILSSSIKAIDIASNDGVLLEQYKKNGFQSLGVDPAQNLALEASIKGLLTLPAYWSENTAQIVQKQFGKSHIINASNVFAHVDNLHDFMRGIVRVLDVDGIFCIEVPHVLNYLQSVEFDTTYHEHVSYMSVHAIEYLYKQHGLEIIDIEELSVHGGTIRVIAGFKNRRVISPNVRKLLVKEQEMGLLLARTYQAFNKRVQFEIKRCNNEISKNLKAKKKIVFFGASAKGTVLLNNLNLKNISKIKYVVDETPEKLHLWIPNLQLFVISIDELKEINPEVLFITPWNFSPAIIDKTRYLNCDYIIPKRNEVGTCNEY